MFASGGTSLYQAVARAFDLSRERAAADPSRNHAVVVMTDGVDESSDLTLAQLQRRLSSEGEPAVRIYTIAYGDGASDVVLVGAHPEGSPHL